MSASLCLHLPLTLVSPGALGIAGVTKYAQENMLQGQTFVAITSGANMDFDRLRFVSERADSTETLIKVKFLSHCFTL